MLALFIWLFFLIDFCGKLLEDKHQDNAEDEHINGEVLGYSATLVNHPPAVFEWVVVTEKLFKKADKSIKDKHKCEGSARFCEGFEEVFGLLGVLCPSPEQV